MPQPQLRGHMIPELGRIGDRLDPLGWPAVRIGMGILLLPHGVRNLAAMFGVASPGGFFLDLGLPVGGLWAYAGGMLHLVCGMLLVLGAGTRLAALLVAGFMVYAILAHAPAGFFWTNGGFEYPLLLLIVSAALVIKGSGAYSADRKLRPAI